MMTLTLERDTAPMNATPSLLPPRAVMERAFAAKDTEFDGVFYVAVRTTGIFCRPSCPSRPLPENTEFLGSIPECLAAGYRPCKRCRPLEAGGKPPEWVTTLLAKAEAEPGAVPSASDLAALDVTPERARRWFQQHYGMSFAAWCRGQRLAHAFTRLKEGGSVDDATFDAAYESHSGFREAFTRAFGDAPGRARADAELKPVVLDLLESPVGPLLAGANDEGVCLLEFSDRRMLPRNLKTLRQQFGTAVVPGKHRWLDQVRRELAEYFAGTRKRFEVPLASRGTEFQMKVWDELLLIPHGTTISYDDLAMRIGQPTAQRAVARANGMNRICILIPCHRVIGKDGSLTGYGGGVWRKRLLLELERSGKLPGATSADPSEAGGFSKP
ncbi:MAG: methylated-DNA--[protein]-cysteine S-methyltransferase [Verrucomicrobiales bacterium]|nr:methylated-DNA--[protein]-cysteine S-methyltransferase [Verrucomicrobiales bacterium]